MHFLSSCADCQAEDEAVEPNLGFPLTFYKESFRTPYGKHRSFILGNEPSGASSKHFQDVVHIIKFDKSDMVLSILAFFRNVRIGQLSETKYTISILWYRILAAIGRAGLTGLVTSTTSALQQTSPRVVSFPAFHQTQIPYINSGYLFQYVVHLVLPDVLFRVDGTMLNTYGV